MISHFEKYNLEESLVDVFSYNPDLNEVTLVVTSADYTFSKPNPIDGAKSDRSIQVHKLVFNKVNSFSRTNAAKVNIFKFAYHSDVIKSDNSMYGIKNVDERKVRHFSACLGSIGDVRFQYERIHCEVMVLDKVSDSNTDGSYHYVDRKSFAASSVG